MPNPALNTARLIFDNTQNENFSMTLYDSSGNQVMNREGIRDNSFVIGCEDLETGIYFVKLASRKKIYTEKIIVKR